MALIFLTLSNGMLRSQESVGKIIGTVTDVEGSPLPGVTVEATSPQLVGKATAITKENGVYHLLALPSGTYTLTFVLPGFDTIVRKNISLRLEQTLTVDMVMKQGKIEEEIVVIGETPLIDVKSTTKDMTITKDIFEHLPKGRDFESLVSTISGVNNEQYLRGISVDGSSGAENVFFVDGVNISNLNYGIADVNVAFEFVDEIQVKASGYQAEYGGSMGGVINVITRSGGNEYHGEVIGYYSGSKFAGKERDTLRLALYDITKAEYINYQDLYGKDNTNRYEVGLSLGGYILKDQLWFFGSFLPVFENIERHVEWQTSPPVSPSDHMRENRWWNGQFKLSANPMKSLRLSAGFVNNFYKYRGDLPRREGTSSPTKAWGEYGFDYPNYSVSINADLQLGNNLLIDANGGYFYKNKTNQQIQPDNPRYAFQGEVPSFMRTTNIMFPEIPSDFVKPRGWTNMSYWDIFVTEKNINSRASANLNLSYYIDLVGEHALKTGIRWVRIREDVDNTSKYEMIYLSWDNAYSDPITGEETRGKYGYYAVRGGESGPFGYFYNAYSDRWAFYLQDSWTPSFFNNKLTLNFGLRAEKEDIPSFSDLPEYQYPPVSFSFRDKLAPRFGFIYDAFGDGSLKLYSSFGIYHDVMKLSMATQLYGGYKWISDFYTLEDWDFTKIGKGNYPGTYIDSYNYRLPTFDTTDPGLQPMTQSEFSFGAEKKIAEHLLTSIRFVYKHLIRAIEDVGVQTPGGAKYYMTNPGYGWSLPVSQGGKFSDKFPPCPKAKRDYVAFNFDVVKNFSNNWIAGFSYTWSRLWGNYSGLVSSDQYGNIRPNTTRYWDLWWLSFDKDLEPIDGVLQTDRPHQFKLFGNYSFDFGLNVGLVAHAMSGMPISREFYCGIQGYYPDGRLTDGRTPFLFYSNLYLEYNLVISDSYKIQINMNVDNILDTRTTMRVYSVLNQRSVYLTDSERLAGWTYDASNHTVTTNKGVKSWIPDPRFGMAHTFYPPREFRIGLKFIF